MPLPKRKVTIRPTITIIDFSMFNQGIVLKRSVSSYNVFLKTRYKIKSLLGLLPN